MKTKPPCRAESAIWREVHGGRARHIPLATRRSSLAIDRGDDTLEHRLDRTRALARGLRHALELGVYLELVLVREALDCTMSEMSARWIPSRLRLRYQS